MRCSPSHRRRERNETEEQTQQRQTMESRPPASRPERTAYDDVQGASRKNERRRRCRRREKCDQSDKKRTNQFEGDVYVEAGEERPGKGDGL